MAEFLSPGVYVLEESSGEKPIAGVGTSTGAFLGIAERGPLDEPVFIANFTQFVQTFGSFCDDGVLAYAVYQFFKEGGARCYVVRIAESSTVAGVQITTSSDPIAVSAMSDGSWGNNYSVSVQAGTDTDTFMIKVWRKEPSGKRLEIESFDKLTVWNFEETINTGSQIINIASTAASDPQPPTLPTDPQGVTYYDLAGGGSDTANIDGATFDAGLQKFDIIDDINILAAPDAAVLAYKNTAAATTLTDTISNMAAYCQGRGDVFFVADTPKGKTPAEAKAFKTDSQTGVNSTFGALYYPWIYTNHPLTGKKILLPPSGSAAGIIAATDIKIGVHKAPAGLATGVMKSVSGIERKLTKSEHDILNPIGLNVIRYFETSGITVWGARTTTTDMEWKYINVRRLFLFVEESIDEGTQWVVFEPNSPQLWGQVNRSITSFLTTVWRSGALFGATPEEA